METDASNTTQREYVWIGNMPVMVRVYSGGTATEYDVWSDNLNTPRVVTDGANNVVWRWDSDAYGNGAANGNPRNIAGQNFTFNLRFPGQYFDAWTGLHYNWMRDYNPRTGRYVESDPIRLSVGSLSPYTYGFGSPAEVADSAGECPFCAAMVVGGLYGAISSAYGVRLLSSLRLRYLGPQWRARAPTCR